MGKEVLVKVEKVGEIRMVPMHMASHEELRKCSRVIVDGRGNRREMTPAEMEKGEMELHRLFTQEQKRIAPF